MACNVVHYYLHEWGPYSFGATSPFLACRTALLPDLEGIDHICSKANCMSLLVSRYFNGTLKKFYTCMHMSIALVVV